MRTLLTYLQPLSNFLTFSVRLHTSQKPMMCSSQHLKISMAVLYCMNWSQESPSWWKTSTNASNTITRQPNSSQTTAPTIKVTLVWRITAWDYRPRRQRTLKAVSSSAEKHSNSTLWTRMQWSIWASFTSIKMALKTPLKCLKPQSSTILPTWQPWSTLAVSSTRSIRTTNKPPFTSSMLLR